MAEQLSYRNFYKHPRFYRHALMWAIFFLFASLVALTDEGGLATPNAEDQRVLAIGLLELIVMIYSSFFAFNVLFRKNKFGFFALVLVIIIFSMSAVDHFFNTGIIQMGGIKGFWANIVLFPVVLLMAFGFKLTYHGAKNLFIIQRLEAKQVESELNLLKSQVNPHFLFNTLNNIYSTNLKDHDKANDIILELADLLRYQLESNKKEFTSLQDEINSLENYIDIERLRVRDCDIALTKEGDFVNAQIIPLILLPFVENAFKYGTGIEKGEIDIKFEMDSRKMFHFYCKNKIVQKRGRVHSGGIGVQNVQKRLNIMYQGYHELKIDHQIDNYIVDLMIQL